MHTNCIPCTKQAPIEQSQRGPYQGPIGKTLELGEHEDAQFVVLTEPACSIVPCTGMLKFQDYLPICEETSVCAKIKASIRAVYVF